VRLGERSAGLPANQVMRVLELERLSAPVRPKGNSSPVRPEGNPSSVRPEGNPSPVRPEGNPSPVRPEGNRRTNQPAESPSHLQIDLDAIHGVISPSGTTGRPKGAMLTYGNHFWSATGSALPLGLHADDRWLACLPLFHIGGLSILFKSVIYGIP